MPITPLLFFITWEISSSTISFDAGSNCDSAFSAKRLCNPAVAIYKFVAESAPVADKISVDLAVETVAYPPQHSITFAGSGIAAETAMRTYRRRGLKVPVAGEMSGECLIGKNARRTNLNQDYR